MIHKTLPNEFDRHDPSVLRGLDGEDLALQRFVAESEESRPTWSTVDLVLDGRLLSLPSLFDAVGRLAGLGLLHHCVNDVLLARWFAAGSCSIPVISASLHQRSFRLQPFGQV